MNVEHEKVLDYVVDFQSFFLLQKRSLLYTSPRGSWATRDPASSRAGTSIGYLQESAGIVLFEDFQAVLHHAGGLAELHGAVGDLIAHHLMAEHTRRYEGLFLL